MIFGAIGTTTRERIRSGRTEVIMRRSAESALLDGSPTTGARPRRRGAAGDPIRGDRRRRDACGVAADAAPVGRRRTVNDIAAARPLVPRRRGRAGQGRDQRDGRRLVDAPVPRRGRRRRRPPRASRSRRGHRVSSSGPPARSSSPTTAAPPGASPAFIGKAPTVTLNDVALAGTRAVAVGDGGVVVERTTGDASLAQGGRTHHGRPRLRRRHRGRDARRRRRRRRRCSSAARPRGAAPSLPGRSPRSRPGSAPSEDASRRGIVASSGDDVVGSADGVSFSTMLKRRLRERPPWPVLAWSRCRPTSCSSPDPRARPRTTT